MIKTPEYINSHTVRLGWALYDLRDPEQAEQYWYQTMVYQYGLGIGKWPIEAQIKVKLSRYPELRKEIENDEIDWFDNPKELLSHINWWINCKFEAEDYNGPYYKLND